MARLRQQYSQNYGAAGNISVEFENVIRYLNAAELGNKTLAELLQTLFDEDGEFDGPIEFRIDSSAGLQYRVGEYEKETDGWLTIAALADIRGPAGRDVGDIGAPIFHGRADFVATSSQTDFTYVHTANDTLLVYVNGILKRPGLLYDYTSDNVDTITFNAGLTLSDKVAVFKVRSTAITGYTRSDTVTSAPQAVFPFTLEPDTKIMVYKNGLLQREGGSYDYTVQEDGNTITFTSTVDTGNLVTILTVENISERAVTGLMLEDQFCDTSTGKILLSRVQIDDGALAQAKVSGLVSALSAKAKLSVSSSTPLTPSSGDLWVDTSQTPNLLKFFDGTSWLRTTPNNSLPSFTTSDAGRLVQVNGAGTGLEYADLDLSSVLPVTARGSANGVASLDSSGRLPSSQLPQALISVSYAGLQGSPSNAAYVIQRIYKQKVRLEGIAIRLASGTCNVQVAVNGVAQGITYAASSTPNEVTIASPIEVDATSGSKTIGFIVSSGSTPTSLDIVISGSLLSA